MTTLVLQHFEKYWEEGLAKNGTSFHEINQKVIDFLMNNDIDNVIVTQFEDVQPSEEHESIIKYCESHGINIEFITYGYGWERDRDIHNDDDLNYTWCYGTRDHHDYETDIIEIEQWQRDLEGKKVLLGGAFHGECILDMQTAFDALELNYETIEELVVGTGVEYEWKNTPPKEISEAVEAAIQDIDDEINDMYEEHDVDNFIELINLEPQKIREIEENVNKILLENIENIKIFDISPPYSDYEEINDVIDYIFENEMEHEDYYFDTEEPLKRQLFTRINDNLKPETYYHGTFWNKPLNEIEIEKNCFLELRTEKSHLDVVYISDSLVTAEWFSTYHQTDPLTEIPCVMKISKHLNKTFEWEQGDERDIFIKGQELDFIQDREEVFQALKNDYDAVIIKNNYPEQDGGDDIACLDNIEENEIKEVKLYINDEWTDFQKPEKAIETIKKHFLKADKKIKNKLNF